MGNSNRASINGRISFRSALLLLHREPGNTICLILENRIADWVYHSKHINLPILTLHTYTYLCEFVLWRYLLELDILRFRMLNNQWKLFKLTKTLAWPTWIQIHFGKKIISKKYACVLKFYINLRFFRTCVYLSEKHTVK